MSLFGGDWNDSEHDGHAAANLRRRRRNLMSDEDIGDVFDVDRIRDLIQLMIEHGLSEVDLRQHGQTIRLRRGGGTSSFGR